MSDYEIQSQGPTLERCLTGLQRFAANIGNTVVKGEMYKFRFQILALTEIPGNESEHQGQGIS